MNTKEVTDRRSLQFTTMADILADMERLDQTPRRTTGNWSAAQIVQHVTIFIDGSMDGFDFKVPWLIRMMMKLMKNKTLNNPLKPGFTLPANMQHLVPDPQQSWDEAVANLRSAVGRIRNGEQMTVPSPAFGMLPHDEWVKLHCRHAELHFSFIHPV